MAVMFALSWTRPPYWAVLLGKPAGRAVSNYLSTKYDDVASAAAHINSINPEMGCKVEVFT